DRCPLAPHAFPTRRSSDLHVAAAGQRLRRAQLSRTQRLEAEPLPGEFLDHGSARPGVILAHAPHRRLMPAPFALEVGWTERAGRSEEHTSELQSPDHLVCR